jgi:MFS family permease
MIMRQIPDQALTTRARWVVLISAFLGLVFDGIELGLMPIASLSVSQSLLAETYTKQLGGEWFAWFTAALMLGAAIGGIVLGNLGDRIGRTRAMGISILFYSLFAMLGAWVQTQEQMLALRFLVGLGVGGLWPNAMALVSECWPTASRAWVAGLLSAGLNAGILLLSQITRLYPVEPNAWRWLFGLAGLPTLLGIFALLAVPESPLWLAHRSRRDQDRAMAQSDSSKRFALSALFETSMWKSPGRHPACRSLVGKQMDDTLGGFDREFDRCRVQVSDPRLVGIWRDTR